MKKPPNTLFNTLQLLPWCLQMYFYLIFEYGGIALPQRVKQIHVIMVNVFFNGGIAINCSSWSTITLI